MSTGDISNYREEYGMKSLTKSNMAKDPQVQFQQWFDEAIAAHIPEPNAMTLATVDSQGQPSIRVVLLKEINNDGLVFYTNYKSQKALELAQHPQAAMNFFWQALERQVRLEGTAQQVSAEQSDKYFQSRPRDSQIGAWASPQSDEIPDRTFLESNLKEYQKQFQNNDIPRPKHWGGFLLKPAVVEFWQGGANRLHDRMQYRRSTDGWTLRRLAP